MRLARIESHGLSSECVGTEHILIGLRVEDSGFAAGSLRQAGVAAGDLRNIVIKGGRKVESPPPIGRIPFSDLAKKALEMAFAEAEEMRHNYIGTEHLLLGILDDVENNASKILVQLGYDIELIKQELYEIVGEAVVQSRDEEEEEEEVVSGSSTKQQKGRGSKKALAQFGRDLTKLAAENKLDPVIGREDEIERINLILARRTKNNPLLLGEPGVGKTAIIEGIAQRIASGDCPESILKHRLIALDLTAMVAGTKYRGQFEERIKAVIKEAMNEDIILFIDEMHTLVGAGAAEGAIDAANVLKPALSRGEIKCIGATTLDEYRKYLEKDKALARRFQKVVIEPPSRDDTVRILKGLQSRYEKHHRVKYHPDAIVAAVDLADRYITTRFLPDKAIDVIDEAGARKVLELYRPKELLESEARLGVLKISQKEAIASQDFETAASYRDDIVTLSDQINRLRIRWKKLRSNRENVFVSKELIAYTVAKITGIPVDSITTSESDRLLALESELDKMVIGQKAAKEILAKSLRRTRAGLGDPKRPIGCFLFLGPTGVGKTLLVKAMAKSIFGDVDSLISLDMSEYMEKHNVSRLVGAPPGYVGYEEGGQLTEAVRRKPYSIVLFDEIEKAHSEIYNTLLQIMEEGKLTDSMGRVVDFRHCIIVLTSNVGSDAIKNKAPLGFGGSSTTDEEIEKQLELELTKTFKPEFLNRLDAKVIFKQLTKEELNEVLNLELNKVAGRLEAQKREFELTKEAREFLLDKGWHPEFGARPLRRAVERYVENLFAEEILKGNFEENTAIMVDKVGDEENLYLVM